MSSAKNIAYRVELTARASLDLESIYQDIGTEDSEAAAVWFSRLEEIVFSLDQMPERGVRTEEDRRLRQLHHGSKPHIYRIIYSIHRAAKTVMVIHIRHGARSAFRLPDLKSEL